MSLFGDPKLDDLARRAQALYDALTPAQKAAHRREQAIDWIFAEARIGLNDTWPEAHLTREECAAIYDKMHGKGEG